jgi:flagellar biosynthetic protein FliQ
VNEAAVLDIASKALWASALVSAPILVTAMAVGLLVGLLQSVTQLQEATLSFVPKFAAVGLVVVISGSWMLQTMISFTTELFRMIPGLVG